MQRPHEIDIRTPVGDCDRDMTKAPLGPRKPSIECGQRMAKLRGRITTDPPPRGFASLRLLRPGRLTPEQAAPWPRQPQNRGSSCETGRTTPASATAPAAHALRSSLRKKPGDLAAATRTAFLRTAAIHLASHDPPPSRRNHRQNRSLTATGRETRTPDTTPYREIVSRSLMHDKERHKATTGAARTADLASPAFGGTNGRKPAIQRLRRISPQFPSRGSNTHQRASKARQTPIGGTERNQALENAPWASLGRD